MTRLLRRRPLAALLCLGLATSLLPLLGRGADDPPAGKKYAPLVGVKSYKKDELRDLSYTENDINDLAGVLRDAGYRRVVLMTQAESAAQGDAELLPTARNVRRKRQGILEDRKPEDTVLIAFSRHGVQFKEEKDSYFCPMDAEIGDLVVVLPLRGRLAPQEGADGRRHGRQRRRPAASRQPPGPGASPRPCPPPRPASASR